MGAQQPVRKRRCYHSCYAIHENHKIESSSRTSLPWGDFVMLFFDNICYSESLSYTFKETQVWHLKWLKSYLHFSRSLSRKRQRGAFIMLSKTPFLLSSLTHPWLLLPRFLSTWLQTPEHSVGLSHSPPSWSLFVQVIFLSSHELSSFPVKSSLASSGFSNPPPPTPTP